MHATRVSFKIFSPPIQHSHVLYVSVKCPQIFPLSLFPENADNSTVTALSCSLQLEVLSTSSSGQLKIWDLRTNTERPVDTMEM